MARALGREPAAVRQLAARARKNVRAARPRFDVEPAAADAIARAFFVASRDGDTTTLSTLLAHDVEIHADGGGKVLAFRNVVRGIERALRLFISAKRRQVLPRRHIGVAIMPAGHARDGRWLTVARNKKREVAVSG